ncbi:MAG: PadR family transcriptional regulator [Anaerolineae bacterium]
MAQPTPDETLLGILMARPQHGYQLLDIFQDLQQLGQVWKLSTSQLYAVLKRLETQRFIIGEEKNSPDAPPRMVYQVTELGKQQVMEWLNQPRPSPSVRRVRVEFLSRLFVAGKLNMSLRVIIQRQKQACRRELASLLDQRRESSVGVAHLSLELNIVQLKGILHWIDRYVVTQ